LLVIINKKLVNLPDEEAEALIRAGLAKPNTAKPKK